MIFSYEESREEKNYTKCNYLYLPGTVTAFQIAQAPKFANKNSAITSSAAE